VVQCILHIQSNFCAATYLSESFPAKRQSDVWTNEKDFSVFRRHLTYFRGHKSVNCSEWNLDPGNHSVCPRSFDFDSSVELVVGSYGNWFAVAFVTLIWHMLRLSQPFSCCGRIRFKLHKNVLFHKYISLKLMEETQVELMVASSKFGGVNKNLISSFHDSQDGQNYNI
jgi:hypothetical protein